MTRKKLKQINAVLKAEAMTNELRRTQEHIKYLFEHKDWDLVDRYLDQWEGIVRRENKRSRL